MIEALLSGRWIAVWRRNYLVWRKLAAASIAGNIIDPLFYLLGFGMGFATMIPEVEGVKYIAFLAGGTICYTTMLAASFEALYSGFARMHVQRTWEGILQAPMTVRDVVLGEWLWAGCKSLLSGSAILLVMYALGVVQGFTPLAVLPVVMLIGVCFAGIALVVTTLARSYDTFTYYFTLVITPMMFLSGVFFPRDSLPPAVQLAFAGTQGPRVLPGTYTARMTKGGQVYEQTFDVGLDRRATFNLEQRQQQYDAALKSFQAVSAFAESRRVPDAMYKVGLCQYELKAFKNARATLNKVISTYPDADAARLAQAQIEKLNAEGR